MGLINIYNEIDNNSTSFHANGKIKDVIPQLKFENCLCLKAGNRLSEDYEITEDDVIYIRMTPSAISSTALAVVSIATTVIALGVGIGVGIYQYNKNQELQDMLEKQTTANSNNVTKLPFLKGAKNQNSMGKTIPYVMGEMYHTPYLLNNGFYTISGDNGENQMWNCELISGYSDQKLKSVSIGTTKIADYNPNDISQDGIKAINDGIYQTANKDCKIEVSTNSELILDGLNQKVVAQVYNAEVKHEHDEDAEPLIEQCAENVQRVEVCIQFDGLRKYDSDKGTYVEKTVQVIPYWSNNPDTKNPTWHEFKFDISGQAKSSFSWVSLSESDVQTAISNGYITTATKSYSVYGGTATYTEYLSTSSEYRVTCMAINGNPPSGIGDWKFEYHQETVYADNTIIRNTNKTCRFVAKKTFTAEESFGKNISIKLVKVNPKEESGTSETCILQYIQTWCYDAQKSTSIELVPCRPLENPFRDKTLRIGLSMVANDNTNNVLDEINIITTGIARTWNGTTWSSDKTPTRNPASWILELLTSDKHSKSKYLDSELDLNSFGALYEYCEDEEFYCDGIITDGKKKRDIVESILSSVFADMILNADGKIEIVIDKEETTPVALINSQNVKSITYAKKFEREITGLKTTYVDRNSWTSATEYFMRDGRTTYNQEEDTLTELALDYVTTHKHAYKIAQRKQRQTVLQPRTINVDVGLEGDYYPLYSTVLLQIERFKQGIQSATIHDVVKTNNYINKFVLSDKIDFAKNTNYGLIIQAQNENGKRLIYVKLKIFTEDTRTDTVEMIGHLDDNAILPSYNNIVSVGLLDSNGNFTTVTNRMKIVGVKPSDNHGWSLELKDYNEDIYSYGVIPPYKSNLTSRPTTQVQIEPMKPVDYDGLKWEVKGEIDKFENDVNEKIDGIVTSATVCSMTLSNVVLEIDDEGFTQTVQTFETVVSLKRSEMNIDFQIGDMYLPTGFSLTSVEPVENGKKLTFTVGEGIEVNAGYFTIPVVYKQIISSEPFVDENNQSFVDENSDEFLDLIYGADGTVWNLCFNYIGNSYGRYLGKFTTLSQIPASSSVSDYFVWGGTNRTTSTLAYEGFFRQGQTYKYIGTGKTWSWEVDTNSGHMQSALSDVLSIANADLENNNSTVWEYLDHLTANSVYCGMLVANEGFIEQLASKIITADLVTTDRLTSVLDDYETKDGLTTELKKYVESNKLFDSGSTTMKGGVLDLDSIKDIAIRNGNTLIAGGYINTNVLDVETIIAGTVNAQKLQSGTVYDLSKYGYASQSALNDVSASIPQSASIVFSTKEIYYKTKSKTAPAKPSSKSSVVDSNIINTWTRYAVAIEKDYYIYACSEVQYLDLSTEYTDVYIHAKTIIDGGYIRTGLLQADEVKAIDGIFDNIEVTNAKVSGRLKADKGLYIKNKINGYNKTLYDFYTVLKTRLTQTDSYDTNLTIFCSGLLVIQSTSSQKKFYYAINSIYMDSTTPYVFNIEGYSVDGKEIMFINLNCYRVGSVTNWLYTDTSTNVTGYTESKYGETDTFKILYYRIDF